MARSPLDSVGDLQEAFFFLGSVKHREGEKARGRGREREGMYGWREIKSRNTQKKKLRKKAKGYHELLPSLALPVQFSSFTAFGSNVPT